MQAKKLSNPKRLVRRILPRKALARTRLGLMQFRMGRELRKLHMDVNGAFVQGFQRKPNPITIMEKFEALRKRLNTARQRMDSSLFKQNPELQERYSEAKFAFGFAFGLRTTDIDAVIAGTKKIELSGQGLTSAPEKVAEAKEDIRRGLAELRKPK